MRRLTSEMAAACARRGVKITSLMTRHGRLDPFRPPRRRCPRILPRMVRGSRRHCRRDRMSGGRNAIRNPDLPRLRRRGAARGDPFRRTRLLAASRRPCGQAGPRIPVLGADVGRPRTRPYDRRDCSSCRIVSIAPDFAVPLKAMIDIDHGDVASPNPADTDLTPGPAPSPRARRSSTSSRARPTRAATGPSPRSITATAASRRTS